MTRDSEPKPHVRRPMNKFMLFRRWFISTSRDAGETGIAGYTYSFLATKAWAALSTEEKALWGTVAEEVKLQHAIDNPGYVYKPKRKKVTSKSKGTSTRTIKAGTERRYSLSPTSNSSEKSENANIVHHDLMSHERQTVAKYELELPAFTNLALSASPELQQNRYDDGQMTSPYMDTPMDQTGMFYGSCGGLHLDLMFPANNNGRETHLPKNSLLADSGGFWFDDEDFMKEFEATLAAMHTNSSDTWS